MDLLFEMTVRGSDGQEAGKLDRVLVDTAKRELTHVILRSPLASEEVILPMNLVQGTQRGELLLHCLTGEIQRMPRYYNGRASASVAGRVDTAPSEALWGRRGPGGRMRRQRGWLTLRKTLDIPDAVREVGPETDVTLRGDVHGTLVGLGTEQTVHSIAQLRISAADKEELLAPDSRIVDLASDPIKVDASASELRDRIRTPVAQYVEVETPLQGADPVSDRFPELAPDDQAARWNMIFEDSALDMRVFVVGSPDGQRFVIQVDDKRLTLNEEQLEALQRFALDVRRLSGREAPIE